MKKAPSKKKAAPKAGSKKQAPMAHKAMAPAKSPMPVHDGMVGLMGGLSMPKGKRPC